MMTQLKKDEQQKTKNLESKIEQMNREIQSLSDTIKDIKKKIEFEDIKFLKVRLPSFLPVSHPSGHPFNPNILYSILLPCTPCIA